jgi:transcriptional regulator with XRE-family HTH domain
MKSAIDQYIIDRVREIRKKQNISQEQLAFSLEFESSAYIGAIESRNSARNECYNSKQLNKIAGILNCSPKDFWPDKAIIEDNYPRNKS